MANWRFTSSAFDIRASTSLLNLRATVASFSFSSAGKIPLPLPLSSAFAVNIAVAGGGALAAASSVADGVPIVVRRFGLKGTVSRVLKDFARV